MYGKNYSAASADLFGKRWGVAPSRAFLTHHRARMVVVFARARIGQRNASARCTSGILALRSPENVSTRRGAWTPIGVSVSPASYAALGLRRRRAAPTLWAPETGAERMGAMSSIE
eukprot:6417724-Pyramimonas_sp.AAC.1